MREARETVLARDPRAFDPKVRNAAAAAVGADIHSKGCNCRKGCGKNYCVCRELRVVCGPRCTCSGPVGCLNGKTEGGDDALATPAKLPITKPGAPAPWFRAALLPNRGVGRPTAEAGLAVSQERKKQKREDVNATTGTPLRNFSQLLSPSFPLLNIDMSPSVGLPDNMDDFQQVMNVNQGIFTPFCMRKIDGSPMSKTVGKMVMGCSKPLHSEVVDAQSTMVQTDPVRRRIALDGLDEDIEMSQAGRNEANDSKTGKRVRLSGGVGCKGNSFKTKEECIADGQDGSHTPEQVAKLSDIDFAMSPTTGNRDCGTWGSMRHTLFERQDKIEVCRLPRILRVKMGSGRPLRKFDI